MGAPSTHRLKNQNFGCVVGACVAALVVTSMPACVASETLRQLSVVQAAVARAADPAVGVFVNLTNDRYLSIVLAASSPVDDVPEKKWKALALAKTAYAAYPLRASLEQVAVSFQSVRSYFGVVTIRRVSGRDAFSFKPSELIETGGGEQAMPPPPERISLYLIPVREGPLPLVTQLATAIRSRFPFPVNVLAAVQPDETMYDDSRGQLRSEDLIAAIRMRYATVLDDPGARVIAITAADMYIRTENWAFALSSRDATNHIAVVLYARMRPDVLGNSPDDRIVLSRVKKMITKDVGIMCYGFPPSHDPRSVLYGSIGGVDDLDVMTEYFDVPQ